MTIIYYEHIGENGYVDVVGVLRPLIKCCVAWIELTRALRFHLVMQMQERKRFCCNHTSDRASMFA